MKISVWCIGKTDEKYLKDGMAIYLKRLKHYARVEWIEYKDVKPGSTPEETTHREADMILTQLKSDDFLILMDERGHSYTSVEFSAFIEKTPVTSSQACHLFDRWRLWSSCPN